MPGGAQRDPLSVEYDPIVRRVLILAIRRHRNHQSGVLAWVPSPRRQFRHLDRGGLTKNERAFTRSAYYQTQKVPRNAGQPELYKLTLEWQDRREPSGRRLARPVRVTLHSSRNASRHRSLGPDGAWRGFRSAPGARIDE